MALFKRKQENQTTLPEIEKYYEAERKERAGLAWLLALISVACVALVVIGLFFGGRWVYNKFTDEDSVKPVATSSDDNSQRMEEDGTESDDSSVKTPSASPAPAPAPQPAPQPSNPTPASVGGKGAANLPNTGAGNIAIVFIVTSTLAWLGHHLVLRRKFSS